MKNFARPCGRMVAPFRNSAFGKEEEAHCDGSYYEELEDLSSEEDYQESGTAD